MAHETIWTSRSGKYPEKYCCCNDTLLGCALFCCHRWTVEDNDDQKEVLTAKSVEDGKKKLIFEKAMDDTVKKINNSWSWACAGLLATACHVTITIKDVDAVILYGWIYFLVIIALATVVSVIPHQFTSSETIAEELEATVPQLKASKGDKEEIQRQQTLLDEAKNTVLIDDGLLSEVKQIANITFIEIEAIYEQMETLFIAIFGNVVALALNDACHTTFDKALDSESDDINTSLTTAYWTYAVILAVTTAYATVRLGRYSDIVAINAYNDMKERGGADESKSILLIYATKRRFLRLLNTSMSVGVGIALRDAIKRTILDIYGGHGTDETIGALWAYCITATLAIAFSNTLSARYYILYPREDTVELQFDTQERKLTAKVFYKNLQTVVAFAWFDVIVETPQKLSNADLVDNVWILWLIVGILSILSPVVNWFWTKAWASFETHEKGAVCAFLNGIDNWGFDVKFVAQQTLRKPYAANEDDDAIAGDDGKTDSKFQISDMSDGSQQESFEFEYCKQVMELMISSISTSAGLAIMPAVTLTLVSIYAGVYDPDNLDDVSNDVIWSMWGAFGIALVVSTLCVTYLGRVVNTLRGEKHKLVKQWKLEVEKLEQDVDREMVLLETNVTDKKSGDDNDDDDDKKSDKGTTDQP